MAMANEKLKSKRSGLTAVLILLVAVTAVLLFLNRENLSFFANLTGNYPEDLPGGEPFIYESGSNQVFALMGDNLAISSSTGLQILNAQGKTLSREIFSMTRPAVSVSPRLGAFFDVGGRALRVWNGREHVIMDTDSPIITVTFNSSGYMALTAQEPGYRGKVTVFNNRLTPIYEWFSGSGYALDAVVSPDRRSLAVLCVESTGSVIRFFRLDSEIEHASVLIPDELVFRIRFMSDGNLVALSQTALHFYNPNGIHLSSYHFGGSFLVNFVLGEEFSVIALSRYISGSRPILKSFASDGRALSSLTLDEKAITLSVHNQRLLVLTSSRVTLLSRELTVLREIKTQGRYNSALLRPGGDVLLLAPHYGIVVNLN